MTRPKFSIRTLLILTACTCSVLTFATQYGNWLIAFLVTILLANVVCVVLALSWYAFAPVFENTRQENE